MSNKTAWLHPTLGPAGFVVLPDGYTMDRREAEGKGFAITAWPDTCKTAFAHPYEPASVVLPRGAVISREKARTAGFDISSRQPSGGGSQLSAWRAAIFASPEACDRPSAVAEIVTSQSPDTMTAEAARAFLRGLPLEEKETE